ncbi:hypothetical protein ACES2L_00680 [Bdellovibrio bacteriovorus]
MNFSPKKFKGAVITVVLLLASSFSFAKDTDIVIIKEGILQSVSKCSELKKKTKFEYVTIPQEVPHSFLRTKIEIVSQGGKRWSKSSYDSESKQVTISVSTNANDNCIHIFGNSSGSDSWIAVKYTVYAQRNSCDQPPVLPDKDAVNASQYERALLNYKKAKECASRIVEFKKQEALREFSQKIQSAIEEKLGARKLEQEKRVAYFRSAKFDLEVYLKKIATFRNSTGGLSDSIQKMHLEFQKAVDFSRDADKLTEEIERFFAEKEAARKVDQDLRKQFPELWEMIRQRNGNVSVNSPRPQANFSSKQWIANLQVQYEDFNVKYSRLIDQIKNVSSQYDSKIYQLNRSMGGHDIFSISGHSKLVDQLRILKSKADEIYSLAIENQAAIQRVQDLYTVNTNAFLCSQINDDSYCGQNFNWFNQNNVPVYSIERSGKLPDIKFPKPGFAIPVQSISTEIISDQNWSNNWSAINLETKNICFTLEFSVSSDSEASARPRSNGLAFVHVNGRPVRFNIKESSIEQYGNKVLRSRSEGCLSASSVKLTNNLVKLAFVTGDGQLLKGSFHQAILYVAYGTINQKIICNHEERGSIQGVNSCSGNLALDLQELDPQLSKKIASLRDEVKHLEIDLKSDNDELLKLEKTLEVYASLSLDQLSPNELRRISDDLEIVASMLENLRYQVKVERAEIEREIQDLLKVASKSDLNDSIFDGGVLTPAVLPDLSVLELQQREVYAGTREYSEQDTARIYSEIENNVIAQLKKSISSRDFNQANEVLKSWEKIRVSIYRRLQARKTSNNEFELYKKMIESVNSQIGEDFDANGFYKAAQIPEDIKFDLTKAKASSEFAEKIKVAMNKNRADALDAQQKAWQMTFYSILRAYKDIFSFDATDDTDANQSRKELESSLLQMAESGFRMGVSFSPAGKFMDFCELVTGKSLCLPDGDDLTTVDRAFAGAGILFGSSLLVKKIAQSNVIRESAQVTLMIEGFHSVLKKFSFDRKTADGFLKASRKIGYKTKEELEFLFSDFIQVVNNERGSINFTGTVTEKLEKIAKANIKKAPRHELINALNKYSGRSIQIAKKKIVLNKERMTHILERHHPKYWDGTVPKNAQQTFLKPEFSVSDVERLIFDIIMKNRVKVAEAIGSSENIKLVQVVDNVEYSMLIVEGKIVQFFPVYL